MHCNICHREYSNASMGGPGICPACDCGIPPEVSRIRDESAQLRAALAASSPPDNEQPTAPEPVAWGIVDKHDKLWLGGVDDCAICRTKSHAESRAAECNTDDPEMARFATDNHARELHGFGVPENRPYRAVALYLGASLSVSQDDTHTPEGEPFREHVIRVMGDVMGELRIARDSTKGSMFEQVADELRIAHMSIKTLQGKLALSVTPTAPELIQTLREARFAIANNLRDKSGTLLDHRWELLKRIDKVADCLSARSTPDTERLDWLEANKRDLIAPMHVPEFGPGETLWSVTAAEAGDEAGVCDAKTAREAIDLAMRDAARGIPPLDGVAGQSDTETGTP